MKTLDQVKIIQYISFGCTDVLDKLRPGTSLRASQDAAIVPNHWR